MNKEGLERIEKILGDCKKKDCVNAKRAKLVVQIDFYTKLAKLPRGLELLLRHIIDDERKRHKILKTTVRHSYKGKRILNLYFRFIS
jgi:hypothetical protein